MHAHWLGNILKIFSILLSIEGIGNLTLRNLSLWDQGRF